MKTVLYIDIARNRRRYLNHMLYVVVFLAVCFVLAMILDRVLPKLNSYMNFPDMITDFLALHYWQAHLYSNIWNLFAVIYPFIFFYTLMAGYSRSIIEEERLETVVYMHNLGIRRNTLLLSKLLIWIAHSFAICLVLFLENVIFFFILGNQNMIQTVWFYSVKLFGVSFVYLAVALFFASYSAQENDCESTCLTIILASFLIARIHAFIQLFADVLTASGKNYLGIDRLYAIALRIQPLQLLCPLVWCYPSQQVTLVYGICAVAVTVVLGVTGYFIYTRDNVIYRNR